VQGQPWHGQLRAYLRFRLGEAEYLIAERTYDAALFAKAADTWYSARELPQPPARVATPDTLGISVTAMLAPMHTEPWAAAAMALDDRARITEPEASQERALAIRREGVEVLLGRLRTRTLLDSIPPEPERRAELAGWLQGMGASLGRLGFDRGDTAMVRLGVRHLQRAAALVGPWTSVAAAGSILHDLGMAQLRNAVLADDGPSLDSALVRLDQAHELRAELPGYTSFVQSGFALARARRLVAWRSDDPREQRRQLGFALLLLESPPSTEVSLGPLDGALLALGRAEVLVDLGCVEREVARFDEAVQALDEVEAAFPRERAPVLATAVDLQRIRIAGQRHATTHSPAEQERWRQVMDRYNLTRGGRTPRRDGLVNESGRRLASGSPRPFDLRYPIPYPF
jgi:hypothetical protein